MQTHLLYSHPPPQPKNPFNKNETPTKTKKKKKEKTVEKKRGGQREERGRIAQKMGKNARAENSVGGGGGGSRGCYGPRS